MAKSLKTKNKAVKRRCRIVPKSYKEALAIAVLNGDKESLPILIDHLIEVGELHYSCNPDKGLIIKLKATVESLLHSCIIWSAGMDDIYEFIEARKLLEELNSSRSIKFNLKFDEINQILYQYT